jgi:hypothetical protein
MDYHYWFLNQHNQSGGDEGGSLLPILKPTVIRFSENPKTI